MARSTVDVKRKSIDLLSARNHDRFRSTIDVTGEIFVAIPLATWQQLHQLADLTNPCGQYDGPQCLAPGCKLAHLILEVDRQVQPAGTGCAAWSDEQRFVP